jgi:hypothetical protein
MQFYLSHQNSQKNSIIILMEYMFVVSPKFLNYMLQLPPSKCLFTIHDHFTIISNSMEVK